MNKERIALESIINSPLPYNEREFRSWHETAIKIASEALKEEEIDYDYEKIRLKVGVVISANNTSGNEKVDAIMKLLQPKKELNYIKEEFAIKVLSELMDNATQVTHVTNYEVKQKMIELYEYIRKDKSSQQALSTEVTEPRRFSLEEMREAFDYGKEFSVEDTGSKYFERFLESLSPKKGKEEVKDCKCYLEDKLCTYPNCPLDGLNPPLEPNQTEAEKEWTDYLTTPSPDGLQVIAQNDEWIDKEFCLDGVRVGFRNDDSFISAKWNPTHDCYDTTGWDELELPTKYKIK